MRIDVLSDSHVRLFKDIPKKIIDFMTTVDLIIHAGDFTTMEVLNGLKNLTEVKAVQGNMDSAELKDRLPVKETIEVGNKRIGIIHGSGGSQGIEKRVGMMFDQVDVIVYGHSHESQNRVINGILFFNPGKATDSFGILTIDEGAKGEIISSR